MKGKVKKLSKKLREFLGRKVDTYPFNVASDNFFDDFCFELDEPENQINDMSKKELAALDNNEQLKLLGSISRNDDDALAKFYKNCKTTDKAYLKHSMPLRKKWVEYVESCPKIAAARKNWHKMDDKTRLDTLRKFQKDHSKMMGYKPVAIETTEIEEKVFKGENDEPDRTFIFNGGLEIVVTDRDEISASSLEGGAKLLLNSHADATWHDFDMSFTTVIHENTHAHQLELIDRAKKGLIKKEDNLYFQAQMFEANFIRYSLANDPESYELQPIEKEALGVGNEMIAALKINKNKFGLKAKLKKSTQNPASPSTIKRP